MAHCGSFNSTSVRKRLRTLGSAIVRKLVGHPENKCGEKGYRENGSKSIGRYRGRVPRWLPNHNERGSSRHNCQHKTNNCNSTESKDYILAKFKFGRHGLNHSGPWHPTSRTPPRRVILSRALSLCRKISPLANTSRQIGNARWTPAVGHEQASRFQIAMSARPPKAIERSWPHVR